MLEIFLKRERLFFYGNDALCYQNLLLCIKYDSAKRVYENFLLVIFQCFCFLLQISFSTFSSIKARFFLLQHRKCAYFKHLFYAKYRHKIIKKMCFWGNERQSKSKIKSLKAMAFLYVVASICESSRSYKVECER